jgi:hypothetical protein
MEADHTTSSRPETCQTAVLPSINNESSMSEAIPIHSLNALGVRFSSESENSTEDPPSQDLYTQQKNILQVTRAAR